MRFTKDHEWVELDGDIATVGITAYAADALGDVVFLELPAVGKTLAAGDGLAVVESVKAASDVYAPVSGEVVEANAAIFQGAHNNVEQRGMGTTLTALAVLTTPDAAARFALLNVGDSRTYVMRQGRLRRVSIDHSYVQELVSTGHITELEARNHPRRRTGSAGSRQPGQRRGRRKKVA